MTQRERSFVHDPSFEQGETAGNVHLGKFETHYEEIFADVIEDGVITADERARLDRAADSLGLDKNRLGVLEAALQASHENRHRIKIKDLSSTPASDHLKPRSSRVSIDSDADERTSSLKRRVAFLEARVATLEKELETARSSIAVEVDLSEITHTGASMPLDDPTELLRRLRHDPRDVSLLRGLYKFYASNGDIDRCFCLAQALTFLGAATNDETATFENYKGQGLIRPTTSLTQEAWRKLLFHPDEEILVGEIFGVIVSAVLLGRISALHRDGLRPTLNPKQKQDAAQSTIQGVRGFSWASAILALRHRRASARERSPDARPWNSRLWQGAILRITARSVSFDCLCRALRISKISFFRRCR
jgi:hypothetical protein